MIFPNAKEEIIARSISFSDEDFPPFFNLCNVYSDYKEIRKSVN